MASEEATVAVIDALEALEFPYMLVGSFSSNYYGVPRATQDADFLVQIDQHSISALVDRLGSRFRLEPQMSFETVTATTRYLLRFVETTFEIEIFLLGDDAYDRERFGRRRRVTMLGRHTFLPTPEDVIVTKLRWSRLASRAKDTDDVRNVIAVQGNRIDWDYVNSWCDEHGTRDTLDALRRELPDD